MISNYKYTILPERKRSTQDRINNFFYKTIKDEIKSNVPDDIKIKFLTAEIALYGIATSGNMAYQVGKNLFNKYVEEPRQQLERMTYETHRNNALMQQYVRNQEQLLKNQIELLQLLKNREKE